jgi:hypothetical protein
MRRLQARGLFAALENEELDAVPPVEEVAEELPEHAESLEAGMSELNQEQGEINEQEAQIDEAEDTIEALESIREQLIEADKEGGLTKSGASILRVTLEHMYNRLNLPIASEKIMPALESFGGSASRQSATQIALENVNETIAKVWAAIVEAAKKAWEWIKGWFNKLFDQNTKVSNRAKALIAAATKLGDSGEVKSGEAIENDSIVKALQLDGETTAGAVFASLEKVAKEFASGSKTYFSNLNRLLEEVRAGRAVDLKPEEMSFGLTKASDPTKLGLRVQAGAEVFASEELPGRKHFVSAWGGTTESSFVGMVDRHGEGGDGGKLPVLAKDDIIKIGGLAESLSATIAGTKENLDEAGKALDLLIKAGETHVKASGEAMDDQGKASVDLARVCHKLITGAATGVNKYLLDTCTALLGWGELSIKAHNGSALGNAAEKVGEAAGAAKDKVAEVAGAAAEKVGAAAGAVKDKVGEVAGKVGEAVDKTREKVAAAVAPKK